MERKLTIRGRERHFEQLEDLAAVHAKSPAALDAIRKGAFGDVVTAAERFTESAFMTARDDAHAFEKTGWLFVRLGPDGLKKLGDAPDLFVARVFLDPSGRLLLAPGGVTVKLRADFPTREAATFFEKADVEVVRQLRFGRNLFEVRAPRAIDAVEVSERLGASADVEYAEPKLLEHIERREVDALPR